MKHSERDPSEGWTGRFGRIPAVLCFLVGSGAGFVFVESRQSESGNDLEPATTRAAMPTTESLSGPRRTTSSNDPLELLPECPIDFAALSPLATYFDGIVAAESFMADVQGRVVDFDGKGVAGLSVSARPRAEVTRRALGHYDAHLARGGFSALVEALARAAARAKDIDLGVKTVVTDADGYFRLEKIRAQEWGIHVDAPDGTAADPSPFRYPPPFRSELIVIKLNRVHAIPVAVRFEDGLVPNEAHVSGMSGNRKWTPESPIIGFEEGTYAVTASAHGSLSAATATVTIPVPPGTPLPLPLVIPRYRSLTVRVLVASGTLSPHAMGLTVRTLRRTGNAIPSDAEVLANGESTPVSENVASCVAFCGVKSAGLYDVRLFESDDPRSLGRAEVLVEGEKAECSLTMDEVFDPARFLTLRAVDEKGSTIDDAYVTHPQIPERRIGRQLPDGTILISHEALARYVIGAGIDPRAPKVLVRAPNRGAKVVTVDRTVGEKRVVFAASCRLDVVLRLAEEADTRRDFDVFVAAIDSDRTGNWVGEGIAQSEVLDAQHIVERFAMLQPGRYDVALRRSDGKIVDRVEIELVPGTNIVHLEEPTPIPPVTLEIDAPSLSTADALELRSVGTEIDPEAPRPRAYVDDDHRAVFTSVAAGTYILGDPEGKLEELVVTLPQDAKVHYRARTATALEIVSSAATPSLSPYGLSIGDDILGCADRRFSGDPLARLRRACRLQDDVILEIASGSSSSTRKVPAAVLEPCLSSAFRRSAPPARAR